MKRNESGSVPVNAGQAGHTPSPFIISPRADMLLIVGAVVVCPAILLPLAQLTSPYTVWLMMMTLGAVGHHFPSFLRTYGDRDLFQRYKIRLIIAPVLLFAITLGFSLHELHGMLLISFCWAIWHGMMQHFGFLRIYDSKVRSNSKLTARLDWWISACWFGLCLVFSPNQGGSLLDALYKSGVPIVPLEYIGTVRVIMVAITTTVTLLYIINAFRGNQPRSWMKLGLLLGTFGYVWLVRVMTNNPFLSVALFEMLHDMQYLAIVWAFNRRLVDKGQGSVLMRFLYRPSVGSVALYVGACLAYGALALTVYTRVESGLFKQVLEALLITSGLLHYYYDGFIWKLRQADTQRGLDLEGKGNIITSNPAFWRGVSHVGIICILAVFLARMELKSSNPDELQRAQAILRAVPENPTALYHVGMLLMQDSRYEEAVPHLRKALSFQPDLKDARTSLSDSLAVLSQEKAQAGKINEAIAYSREAVKVEPDSAERLNDLAVLLAQSGFYEEAESVFQRALSLDPEHKLARSNLDSLHQMRGRY